MLFTGILEKFEAPLCFIQRQHKGRFCRVEAKATLVVTLACKMVVYTGWSHSIWTGFVDVWVGARSLASSHCPGKSCVQKSGKKREDRRDAELHEQQRTRKDVGCIHCPSSSDSSLHSMEVIFHSKPAP